MPTNLHATISANDPGRPLASQTSTRSGGLGLLSLALLAAAGCAATETHDRGHPSIADKRWNARTAGMQETLGIAAESESRRPEQTARAFRYIGDAIDRDVESLGRNAAWFGDMAADDINRFLSRQPDYLNEASDILRGKAEDIAPHAIILFL